MFGSHVPAPLFAEPNPFRYNHNQLNPFGAVDPLPERTIRRVPIVTEYPELFFAIDKDDLQFCKEYIGYMKKMHKMATKYNFEKSLPIKDMLLSAKSSMMADWILTLPDRDLHAVWTDVLTDNNTTTFETANIMILLESGMRKGFKIAQPKQFIKDIQCDAYEFFRTMTLLSTFQPTFVLKYDNELVSDALQNHHFDAFFYYYKKFKDHPNFPDRETIYYQVFNNADLANDKHAQCKELREFMKKERDRCTHTQKWLLDCIDSHIFRITCTIKNVLADHIPASLVDHIISQYVDVNL